MTVGGKCSRVSILDVFCSYLGDSFMSSQMFFFFKQKTAYEMRISDWSSDVCSSDLAGEQGHGGGAGREAALHRQRFPHWIAFVLGEAEGVLARRAEGGAVDAARNAAADVTDDELQRAADGRVGAVALAEGIAARIHADGPRYGAVDDRHRP